MSLAMRRSYELRVDGHLDDHWRSRFGALELAHCEDGTSSLTGTVDQAQLHGLLTGLRDIGATVLSVRSMSPPGTVDQQRPSPAFELLEWPVRTERLTLRPARGADAKATWLFRRQASVGRWLTAVPDALPDYRATFEQPDRLATTLIVEREGQVIGDLMLRIEDAWAQTEVADRARGVQAELAWVLDPVHTGHGYGTEAVRELLRLCFDELGVRRVVATCFSDNQPSWRLMERVGMRREQHAVRESLHRGGEWLDVYGYALLAEEWRTGTVRTT